MSEIPTKPNVEGSPETIRQVNQEKSFHHPCFNGCGGKNTRLHLPVAPACTIQCNYCVRKYECVNESRPGVTATVLSPREALERFLEAKQRLGNLDVVGIAGPGDALAEFEKTRETFALIREADPELTCCLSTNGLLLPRYADEIAALGVSHVTVTVNALDPAVGKRIYRRVDFEGKHYTGIEAAAILLENQYAGIERLKALGIICKVNIVMLKGINDTQIPGIVEKVKEAGADLTNIMQLIPVKGSIFEHLPLTSNAEITEMRKSCELILPQMYHCRQCRADAAGTLDEDISYTFTSAALEKSAAESAGIVRTCLFAVASQNGMLVDQHFGHATGFYMYEYKDGQITFIERREVPQYCFGSNRCGSAENTMERILETIAGCSGVIAMRIGEIPRVRLAEQGIEVFMTYNYITDAVREAAERS
ncbi:MAG: radical SAM protein [Treponema sp.]|jgi:nitrogenase cofactor biosynthesis protein NifB|nr:radical SAM protein [Treponema sp.]